MLSYRHGTMVMPKHGNVSLRCALLRLTMAGMVYASVGPLSFTVGFAVSEIIGLLSGLSTKGAMRMVKNTSVLKDRIVKFGKAHLFPYRVPLLMSL